MRPGGRPAPGAPPRLRPRRPGGHLPDGRPINLEIRDSHAVDAAKLAKLTQDNIHAVEISSPVSRAACSDVAFRNFVLANAPRLWLHNPDQGRHNAALATELALAKAEDDRQEAEFMLDTQAHTRGADAAAIVSAICYDAHRAEIAAMHAIEGAQRALALVQAEAQRAATRAQEEQYRSEQHRNQLVAREQARADLLDSVVTWATDYYPSRDKPALAWQTFALAQQEIAMIFGRLPHRTAQLALMDQRWWRENVPASLAKATWNQLEYTR